MHAATLLWGLIVGIGAFLGSVAAIRRYIVRPITRVFERVGEELRDWRNMPAELTGIQIELHGLANVLRDHVAQTEQRLNAGEPPGVYKRKLQPAKDISL